MKCLRFFVSKRRRKNGVVAAAESAGSVGGIAVAVAVVVALALFWEKLAVWQWLLHWQ
jgi:hypothetical protein